MLEINQSFVYIFGEVGKIEILARNQPVEVEHILGLALEVGGGIEAVGDVDSILGVVLLRLISLRDLSELVLHLADDVEGHFDLLLGLVGLHGGADDGDVGVFLGDAVHVGHHHDVDVYV